MTLARLGLKVNVVGQRSRSNAKNHFDNVHAFKFLIKVNIAAKVGVKVTG